MMKTVLNKRFMMGLAAAVLVAGGISGCGSEKKEKSGEKQEEKAQGERRQRKSADEVIQEAAALGLEVVVWEDISPALRLAGVKPEAKQMTSVVIPDGVNLIMTMAFSGCTELTEVFVPDSVTDILGEPFAGCTKLRKLSIPGNCRINESALPEGCEVIRR